MICVNIDCVCELAFKTQSWLDNWEEEMETFPAFGNERKLFSRRNCIEATHIKGGLQAIRGSVFIFGRGFLTFAAIQAVPTEQQ